MRTVAISIKDSINQTELATNLFVEFNPSEVAFRVRVLEAEEPHLSQTDGLDDLVKQLFASRRLLDRELQLRVHRRHTDVHLKLEDKLK